MTSPAVRVVLPPGDALRAAAVRERVQTVLAHLVGELVLPIAPSPVDVVIGDRLAVLIDDVRCAMPGVQYLLRHSSGLEDRIAHAIHLHAEFLVTPDVAGDVWAAVVGSGRSSATSPPPWFHGLVRDLVRHRVRPARLIPLLAWGTATDAAALFESALSSSGDWIRILIDERSSRNLAEDAQELRSLMSFLATGLSDELGMPLAIPRLEVDPELPDHHFAVEVGDLRTLPMPGIRANQILVNDTSERLELLGLSDLAATAVINPATGQPASVTAASFSDTLQATGLTVWTMSGYIVLTTAEVVRRHARALYRTELLRYQLDRLAADHRALGPMVEALGGVHLLTRVLRRLLHEEVPIRDLPVIVPALYGAVPPPPRDPGRIQIATRRHRADVVAAPEVGDVLETSLAETARSAISRAITRRYTRGTTTLVTYLLSPEVENRLRDPVELTAEERRALLDMIVTEIAFLPPTAQLPVILTRAPLRARLRSVIEVEQPKLAVVAYEELSGDLNIQPVARLSLPN